jgi:energy-coupling factor transporter ATP-binding protein EcfA2
MLLRAHELVVRHHPTHPPVLAGVSLHAAAGELVAVVGSNGSGKSTLARALAGLLPLESGRIDGTGAGGRSPIVGLVLQDPAAQLVAATVADEIAVGAQSAGIDQAQVAAIVDDRVARFELDAIWQREPQALSGGQQQRVATASIDACDVDVLVLDEPTALLDEPARHRWLRDIRAHARGRAVVWITQEPDEVALCDRVLVLDAGHVVWAGPVVEYVQDPVRAATWGLELPVAARTAHALQTGGVWLASNAIPVSVEQLQQVLTTSGGHRA